MTLRKLVAVCLVVVVTAATRPVMAEDEHAGALTFGTTSEVAHTVGPAEFQGIAGNLVLDVDVNRGCFGPVIMGFPALPCRYVADLRLPAGALLTSIQLDGCDTSPTEAITFTVLRKTGTAAPVNLLGTSATTGLVSQPGCTAVTAALPTPETIDNAQNAYLVDVTINFDPAQVLVASKFAAVRAFYRLQVSPAPGTASFGDVPTSHPFFQFVEALVASGITAGCGGGNYCPDAPLTRGQMAVFLGKALGLHFAP
jgi:S-layer homology domain